MSAILNLWDAEQEKFVPIPVLRGGTGPQGESGVYYGEDPPISESHPLWIKPSGKVLVDYIYPIGSIYLSVNSTSPAILFGGDWEQLKDTFLLVAGDMYAAGDTGGEATHTLTVDELPTNYAEFVIRKSTSSGVNTITASNGVATRDGQGLMNTININDNTVTSEVVTLTGGGQPMNNMPPYLTVYCWKRVVRDEEV